MYRLIFFVANFDELKMKHVYRFLQKSLKSIRTYILFAAFTFLMTLHSTKNESREA